jgi:hypothetical protein
VIGLISARRHDAAQTATALAGLAQQFLLD